MKLVLLLSLNALLAAATAGIWGAADRPLVTLLYGAAALCFGAAAVFLAVRR